MHNSTADTTHEPNSKASVQRVPLQHRTRVRTHKNAVLNLGTQNALLFSSVPCCQIQSLSTTSDHRRIANNSQTFRIQIRLFGFCFVFVCTWADTKVPILWRCATRCHTIKRSQHRSLTAKHHNLCNARVKTAASRRMTPDYLMWLTHHVPSMQSSPSSTLSLLSISLVHLSQKYTCIYVNRCGINALCVVSAPRNQYDEHENMASVCAFWATAELCNRNHNELYAS